MEKIRKKAEVFSVRKELEESTASENKKRRCRHENGSFGFVIYNYNFSTLAACIPRAPSVKS